MGRVGVCVTGEHLSTVETHFFRPVSTPNLRVLMPPGDAKPYTICNQIFQKLVENALILA